jgi:hypothetical protein
MLGEDVYNFVQASAAEDPDLEGSVLIGYMLIAEWRSPDGHTWLSKIARDHDRSLPPWRQRGYASEVLYDYWEGDWERDEDEE